MEQSKRKRGRPKGSKGKKKRPVSAVEEPSINLDINQLKLTNKAHKDNAKPLIANQDQDSRLQRITSLYLAGKSPTQIKKITSYGIKSIRNTINIINNIYIYNNKDNLIELLRDSFLRIIDSNKMINSDLVQEYIELNIHLDDKDSLSEREYSKYSKSRLAVGKSITENNKMLIDMLSRMGVPDVQSSNTAGSHPPVSSLVDSGGYELLDIDSELVDQSRLLREQADKLDKSGDSGDKEVLGDSKEEI